MKGASMAGIVFPPGYLASALGDLKKLSHNSLLVTLGDYWKLERAEVLMKSTAEIWTSMARATSKYASIVVKQNLSPALKTNWHVAHLYLYRRQFCYNLNCSVRL